jgi:hypothetical protein
VIGDAHHVAGRRVGQVLFGYPQAGADQGVPARGGVGGVHEVDRVGDPAGAADVLRLDAGGSFALLDLPAFIEDQHRVCKRESVKFAFIRQVDGENKCRPRGERFRVSFMCEVLDVSRAGYYAWLKRTPPARSAENAGRPKAQTSGRSRYLQAP